MKRRRFLIVLFAAAIGWAGWRWWTAPNIDPHLVGRWVQVRSSEVDGRVLTQFTFQSNGQFTEIIDSGLFAALYRESHQWSTEGDILSIEYHFKLANLYWPPGAAWEFWTKRLTDPVFRDVLPLSIQSTSRYRFEFFGKDELILYPLASQSNVVQDSIPLDQSIRFVRRGMND